MSTNLELTKRLHDLFSNNQFEDVLAMADDNIEVIAYALGMTFTGKAAFEQFFMGFKNAFPDLVIQHTNFIANGEGVAVEFIGHGTHTGPLATPMGSIPASGNSVSLNGSEFHTWQDGKLIRITNYQDSASLLRQIGALN